MAWNDDLRTARDNLATRIRELSTRVATDHSLDGESLSLLQYQIQICKEMIPQLNRMIDGPVEVRSRGKT